ncbi:hypothetical protein KUTeg_001117 [Tegillarca granosa]|uniref:THAP-type domain-containing protein n=1 Tax=Tegillarca granosa TaxID=220873 RepID=A0ABQ9FVI6_TEGGR|nr:hypothetical protein KUTeg_001117 [Tegillarca granosa]
MSMGIVYPERPEGGVRFIPFPKPRRNKDKCLRWIKLCGRPNDQLNVNIVDGNRHLFVCTKHFIEGEPTDRYPDPVPAIQNSQVQGTQTPARKPPTKRALSEPPRKRRKVLADALIMTAFPFQYKQGNISFHMDAVHLRVLFQLLDPLEQTSENQALKEQVAKLILENENLKRDRGKFKIVPTIRCKSTLLCGRGFTYERFMDIFNFLFGSLPMWPHRYVIIDNMPANFKWDFPNPMVILDGTEIKQQDRHLYQHKVNVIRITNHRKL